MTGTEILVQKPKFVGWIVQKYRLDVSCADDYFSEALLKICQQGEQVSFNYVFATIRNLIFDQFRRREIQISYLGDLKEVVAEAKPCSNIGYGKLRHLIYRLPLRQRQCLIMRFGFDMKYREIAGVMGGSVSTWRSSGKRGVDKLRVMYFSVPGLVN